MDDESALVAYLRTGDADLFRLLVERHQDRVFRLVASVLGPFADLDAEQVTQAVFLQIHEKLASFRGEARFGTWLYRVAYNRALKQRRRARVRLPHVSLKALRHLPSHPPDEDVGQDRRRTVARLVEELPGVYRTVIHMHYWQDSSVEEIAEILGVAAGTVKSYLFRARQRLRERAKKDGLEWLQ